MGEPRGSEYLAWIKQRRPVRYNLARSGVARLALSALSPTLDDLLTTDAAEDGWPPLLDAIAARYGVTPAHVVITHGCSMANHLALATAIERGDDVVMETPVYEPLASLTRYLGAHVVFVARRAENAWHLDPDEVARALTPRTSLVVFSNLHNPTGAFDTEATVTRIADAAENAGARVLVDEVYLDFLYAHGERGAARLSPAIMTTRSVTKVFGMDSLRLGWVLAHPELAARMRRLNDLFSVNAAHPSERLALRALQRADVLLAQAHDALVRNIDTVDRFVDADPRLSWTRPHAGTVGFVRAAGVDVDRLADRLHAQDEVAVVPGRFFGAADHFRLALGLPNEDLDEGLARVARALAR